MGIATSAETSNKRSQFLSEHGIEASAALAMTVDQLQMLDRIIAHEDEVEPVPFFSEAFSQFSNRKKWLHHNSYCHIFGGADQPRAIELRSSNDILKIRFLDQKSGCSMLAPIILQHYLVALYCLRNGRQISYRKVLLSKYVDLHWKGKKLLNYIDSKPGNSLNFMLEISSMEPTRYFSIPEYPDRQKKNF
jgi:hypothetical protein